MNNGFYGLNPQQAIRDIEVFAQAMQSIANTMRKAGTLLFENLSNNWYSPAAVEFSNKYSTVLYDNTVTVIERNTDAIIGAAVDSFNAISLANGGGSIPAYNRNSPSGENNFGFLKESGLNGVGMDVYGVRQAVSEYFQYINTGLSALDNVPNNLAIYDKSGSIQVTFQNCITKIKQVVHSAYLDMYTNLSRIIENETNKLESATQKSSEAISNAANAPIQHLL